VGGGCPRQEKHRQISNSLEFANEINWKLSWSCSAAAFAAIASFILINLQNNNNNNFILNESFQAFD